MRKTALLVLALCVLCTVAFAADWVAIAALAIVPAAIFTAILVLIGYGLSTQEPKFIAQEELYQLIITLVLLGIAVGAPGFMDDLTKEFTGAGTLQEEAITALSSLLTNHKDVNDRLYTFAKNLGYESSQTYYCSMYNGGYNVAPCGAFRQISTPMGLAFQMLGVSAAELETLKTLVDFGRTYALSLVLPAGIILRAFKITRGAGSFFIAFGVSAYLILPATVLAMKEISEKGKAGYAISNLPEVACDEEKADDTNIDRAKGAFDSVLGNLGGYLYDFVIETTLTTVVSLFAFITSIRWLSRLAGAEADVSALMKIA